MRLGALAERVGSADFKWAVLAVNIQREVGGNLAEILDNVADTLRERATMRRQVRVLTSEGRLSAWVLALMPFAIALYMFAVNRDYIMLLFTTKTGLMMLGGAGLLLLGRGPLDEEDRGHRCLRSGSFSRSVASSSRCCSSGSRWIQSSTERKRAVTLLENQVSGSHSVASANLREQELSQSFGQRVLVPFVGGAGRVARRITPLDARDRVAKKLMLAGSPEGWDAERVISFKVILAGAAFVGSLVIARMMHLEGLAFLACVGLLTIVGFLVPDSLLARKVEERQHEVLGTLSDTLDLLTISVEAGLSLNAAIAQVVQNVPGVLSQEFARMLQEIQLGVPRSEAFRHLADRTDVEELNSFALAMIQADVFGVSIASAKLFSSSTSVRSARWRNASDRGTPSWISWSMRANSCEDHRGTFCTTWAIAALSESPASTLIVRRSRVSERVPSTSCWRSSTLRARIESGNEEADDRQQSRRRRGTPSPGGASCARSRGSPTNAAPARMTLNEMTRSASHPSGLPASMSFFATRSRASRGVMRFATRPAPPTNGTRTRWPKLCESSCSRRFADATLCEPLTWFSNNVTASLPFRAGRIQREPDEQYREEHATDGESEPDLRHRCPRSSSSTGLRRRSRARRPASMKSPTFVVNSNMMYSRLTANM